MYDKILFSDTDTIDSYSIKLVCVIFIGVIEIIKVMNNKKK